MDKQFIFSLVIGLPLAACFVWFLRAMHKGDKEDRKNDIRLGRPIAVGWGEDACIVQTDSGDRRYRPTPCPYCNVVNAVVFDLNDFHIQNFLLTCTDCRGQIAVKIWLKDKNLEKLTVEKSTENTRTRALLSLALVLTANHWLLRKNEAIITY